LVQQAAVNALSNLNDGRIFGLMVDRLKNGPFQQKKTILFNLIKFNRKRDEVISVYLKYLEHPHDELRFDALLLLGSLVEPIDYQEIYLKCLDDRYSQIRSLALQRLSNLPASLLIKMMDKIETMLMDPDPEIKKQAGDIIKLKKS